MGCSKAVGLGTMAGTGVFASSEPGVSGWSVADLLLRRLGGGTIVLLPPVFLLFS